MVADFSNYVVVIGLILLSKLNRFSFFGVFPARQTKLNKAGDLAIKLGDIDLENWGIDTDVRVLFNEYGAYFSFTNYNEIGD